MGLVDNRGLTQDGTPLEASYELGQVLCLEGAEPSYDVVVARQLRLGKWWYSLGGDGPEVDWTPENSLRALSTQEMWGA